MSNITTNQLEKDEKFQSVDETGRAPKKRIVNAKAAHAIVKRMKSDGETAAYTRASIQGLYDGNAPISRAEMKRRGYGWMANVDWGEFRNTINLTTTSIWNMFQNVPVFISLKTDLFDPQNPDQDYGQKIALRFTQMLKRWKPFKYDLMRKILDMIKFGLSASFWQDDVDWRSKPIRPSSLLVSAKSECRPGELKMFGIRDEISIEDLFDKIEGEDVDPHWNIPYVRRRILEIVRDGSSTDNDKYNMSDWESMQQMIKNQDGSFDQEFDGIRIIHLFSEEVGTDEDYGDRKVTHQIIIENDDIDENNVEFIFESYRRFEEIHSIINLMLYNISDGWIKSVRGLGRELFHTAHASNRMINSMLDGVVIGSGLLVKTLNAESAMKLNLMRKGPVTVLPSDADIQQQQNKPSIMPTVQARGIIQNINNRNVGSARGRNETLKGDSPTAEQIRSEDSNEADLKSNQAEWYYTSWQEWLEETFRRLMNKDYSELDGGYKERQWFIDKLKSDGIPDKFLDADVWELTATRSIGMGSLQSGFAITNAMVSMKGALDEQGKRNVDREWFARRVGWENVDKFISNINRDEIPTISHSMAESENIDMQSGYERTVPVDDPHIYHWQVHMPGVMKIIKVFMAGQSATIEKDVIAVGLFVDHMTRHLQMLSIDPIRKAQAKQYEQELKQVVNVYKRMGSAADAIKQQKQQLAEQQKKTVEDAQKALASRDLEAKKYESDKKAEVAMYEADKLHEARMAKTNTSIIAQLKKMQADIERMNIKLNAELNMEEQKTNSEINK